MRHPLIAFLFWASVGAGAAVILIPAAAAGFGLLRRRFTAARAAEYQRRIELEERHVP